MIKFTGEIHIGRVSGSGDDYMVIEVRDRGAAVLVLQATLSLADFARAVTSRVVTGEAVLYETERVGKKIEVKHELVYLPKGVDAMPYRKDAQALVTAQAFVDPYCVDGWVPRLEDFFNHHNYRHSPKTGAGYVVTFSRWVDKEEPTCDPSTKKS